MFILILSVFITPITWLQPSDLKTCEPPSTCLRLKTCEPFKSLTSNSQKPLRPSVLKLLKTQICGFYNDEPKVCCPQIPEFITDPAGQLSESPCKPSFQCVSLVECGPLMYLVNLEKPITPGVIKLIKSQQCGSGTIYPKVCCKFTTSPTTTTMRSTMSPQEKSQVMSWIFDNYFFDFMI